MNTKASGLDGDVLTLVVNWPSWMTVTGISFVGSSKDMAYIPGETSDIWTFSEQNLCQGRLTAVLNWNNAYLGNQLQFSIETDETASYLTNNLRFTLEQDITARGNDYVRTYEYGIQWQLMLPKNVDVSFDLMDIYASEYYAQGSPLCLRVAQNAQVAFVLESSTKVSDTEYANIRNTWLDTVDTYIADTVTLGTVNLGDWKTSGFGGTEVYQYIEDFIGKSDYVTEARQMPYLFSTVAATKQALSLAADLFDEFNTEDVKTIVLVTYQPPVTFDDPTSSLDDNENMDVCSLKSQLEEQNISLVILALQDRLQDGEWTLSSMESTFDCLTSDIQPQANVEALLATLSNPAIVSSYECVTDAQLCSDSNWADPIAIETTFQGNPGALTWAGSDNKGSIRWDSTLGWVIDGYGDLVISNDATGPTPTNTITEVTTWFIVPCTSNTPERWPYFRVGVMGYSVCNVGDQAGFEVPKTVTSTAAGVPPEYYTQIGTVSAINVDDSSLGCSATTVEYDDGTKFNYCSSEIRCSDWVNRCEDDCTLCEAYDASGSSDNLVSEFYWTPFTEDERGLCSFGSNTGTCGTEVGPTTASVFYQCVGSKRTVTQRRRALRQRTQISRPMEKSERRKLSGPCHGLWGPWGPCSKSCGKGFSTRTFTHYNGVCAYENGAREVKQCQVYTCPRLQDLVTVAAHFTPDLTAQHSTMFLHFSTHMNAPWQFERHGLTITDQHGAVESSSIAVDKVNENCNGVDICIQEWTVEYVSHGVCDQDGMHKLVLTPSTSGQVAENPLQVVLSLLSHGCGMVKQTERDGGFIARPGNDGVDTEPANAMTIEMDVRRPTSAEDMNNQITELMGIISSHNDEDVVELSRAFKIGMTLNIDHSGASSEVIYDFFDYLPISIGSVLDLPSSTVKDPQIGSSGVSTDMTAAFKVHIGEATKASDVYTLLSQSPQIFTAALTLDLESQASWLKKEVILQNLDDMKVATTVQAKNSDGLVPKLERLGYHVIEHNGQNTNVIPISQQQSQTLEIQQTESSSETFAWQILFGLICLLLVVIISAIWYKRRQDKKQQKAMKATKLYEYQIQKAAELQKKQFEGATWAREDDPTHIPYHTNTKN